MGAGQFSQAPSLDQQCACSGLHNWGGVMGAYARVASLMSCVAVLRKKSVRRG